MPIIQLPQRPPRRRLRAIAVLVAVALHAAVVLLIPLPVPSPGDGAVTLLLPTEVDEMPPSLPAPRESAPPVALEAADTDAETRPDEGPSRGGGAPGDRGGAPGDRGGTVSADLAGAIPFLPRPADAPPAAAAGMAAARAAALPLIVREGGGLGGRRLGRTAEQLAIARAESLLMERLAGIAVVERRDTGAIGLANGGITLAIPWAGFLPADRTDEKWREERCSGGGGGDSDKAGEGEARRAQCD